MTSLHGLDLNLLLVFEALFDTRSVSRAGARLGLSQSATSHALGRLRDSCRDELFLRAATGMTPTPVANRLYPDIHHALETLRHSMEEARGFDPASSTRHFEIAIPHPMGPIYALRIRDAAQGMAPGVRIGFDTRTMADDAPQLMREGRLDIALDWIAAEDERFVNRRLFDEGLVIVARGGHPRAQKRMGWRDLAKEEFIRCHRRASERRPNVLSGKLWDLMSESRLTVSEYLEIPFIVARTDYLGVLPASMAPIAEQEFRMIIIGVPGPPILLPIWLSWHESRRRDAGHAWLRGLVAREMIAAQAEIGVVIAGEDEEE